MAEDKILLSDKELTIMNEIIGNENITQRELSKKLGISVSTVNVLINKMIKEGFIKMTQVSQKQVFYMLTPGGMMEKAKKTVKYLKFHYRAIYEMKEKIKSVLEELGRAYDGIFLLCGDNEMGEVLGIAVDEYHAMQGVKKIRTLDNDTKLDFAQLKAPVMIHMMMEDDLLEEYKRVKGLEVIDLTQKL